MKLGIGLYGANGHQIYSIVQNNAEAELVAVAGVPEKTRDAWRQEHPDLRCYGTLDELLRDDAVQLVSLCSPVRRQQAGDALLCMRAGKHVYAEKPCAMTVTELDGLMAAAREHGVSFHEMAGTAFDEPYRTMREVVRSGRLGTIVQVLVQKSYPFHLGRPQDEDVDGGLLCQVGIHALRMVEHVAGRKIVEISANETDLGNPVEGGGLKMAASYAMKLEDGATGAVIANYLNQRGFGLWGNEMLRIFGTEGFVESTDGGARTRLVVGDEDLGPLDIGSGARDYFDLLVDSLLGGAPIPLTVEEELHPLRAVLMAKESARQGGVYLPV